MARLHFGETSPVRSLEIEAQILRLLLFRLLFALLLHVCGICVRSAHAEVVHQITDGKPSNEAEASQLHPYWTLEESTTAVSD